MLVDAVMGPVGDSVKHLKLPHGAHQRTLTAHERLDRAIKARKPALAYRIMFQPVLDFRESLKRTLARSQ
jgi:DNA-binding GntR family transcriptional regulator